MQMQQRAEQNVFEMKSLRDPKKQTEIIISTLLRFSVLCIFATACAVFIHTNFARLTTLNNDVLHVNFTRRLAASLAE